MLEKKVNGSTEQEYYKTIWNQSYFFDCTERSLAIFLQRFAMSRSHKRNFDLSNANDLQEVMDILGSDSLSELSGLDLGEDEDVKK